MATQSSLSDKETLSDTGSLRVSDLLVGVGFGFMLAWHYLILFSPVFGDLNGDSVFEYLFERQAVLYVALMLAFGFIWLRGIPKRKNQANAVGRHVASPVMVIANGVFAVIVSAAYALVCTLQCELWVRLVLMGVLGISEAMLMFLWLRCFINRRSGQFLRSFSIDMIAGGLLALAICLFQWPAGVIVACLAPGLSSVILCYEAIKAKRRYAESLSNDKQSSGEIASESESNNSSAASDKKAEDKDDGRAKKSLISSHNIHMTTFVAIYALAFGLMQGAFIAAHTPYLMVLNALPLIGIVVAGLVIFLVPQKLNSIASIDFMHRVSLILFIIGSVVIMWSTDNAVLLTVSQIAILAGFNLFDFGILVYGVEENRSRRNTAIHVVDRARPVVYLCLTIGLIAGFYLIESVPSDLIHMTLLMSCGSIVIVVVATVMLPFYTLSSQRSDSSSQKKEQADKQPEETPTVLAAPIMAPAVALSMATAELPEDWESPWRRACNQIARMYQLSPRETEIFFLVAKGRNADYIQQELVISTHTAKTHIANIYRKLEVHSSQELLDLVEDFKSQQD